MAQMSIPQSDFYLREGGEWAIKTSRDLFVGQRTVLVMVPGAFTPTCSNQQVPEFEAAYDEIISNGVDQVVVLSVNDAFVMDAWKKSLKVKKLKFVADGNGEFTLGVKAAVAKNNRGMGGRAWRLALILNENGIVEWAGVEEGKRDNASDDPYVESTPTKVIEALKAIKAYQEQAAAAEDAAMAEAVTAG